GPIAVTPNYRGDCAFSGLPHAAETGRSSKRKAQSGERRAESQARSDCRAISALVSARLPRCHHVAAYHSAQLTELAFKLLALKSLRRCRKNATPAKAALSAVRGHTPTQESGRAR